MANITLSVPSGLKQDMDAFPVINWSEVAREAFAIKISQLKMLRDITSKSKLTEADAAQLAKKINAGIAKRHGW